MSMIWSVEQKKIFDWFSRGEGNLVVQARAGTGKTSTIVEAFSHVVGGSTSIGYAVFNKKMQLEAAGKISDGRVEVKTLHALGYGYIRNMWPGSKPDSFVERDRVAGVARTPAGKKMLLPADVVSQVVKLVGFAKNLYINPTVDDIVDIAWERGLAVDEGLFDTDTLARLALATIEAAKVRDPEGRISFDDMVWLPVSQGWARPKYDLVVVDEAQDMNLPQLTMAVAACKPGGRICVVGDDRQAIYGFRGAVADGMRLMTDKLHATTMGLTTTYRCPAAAVKIAQSIVPDYVAAPSAPAGIVDTSTSDGVARDAKPGEVVLSRTNAPLMPLCLALLRAGTPARIEGRDIGKQLLVVLNRLKARSVPEFMLRIRAWETRQIARLKSAGKEAGVDLIRDQALTLIAVAEGCSNVDEIRSRLDSLFRDSAKERRPAVVLSSVHRAKGLEWVHVFLLSDTFRVSGGGDGEEANLYYVAVTRTQQRLTLVSDKTNL